MRVPSRQSKSARRVGGRSRHPGNAARAARTASSISLGPAEGALVITSPVAGFTTSNRSPSRASTSSPPIMRPCSRPRNSETSPRIARAVAIRLTLSDIRYDREPNPELREPSSGAERLQQDRLELPPAQVERGALDPLGGGVHVAAARRTDRERGDTERERRVRIR